MAGEGYGREIRDVRSRIASTPMASMPDTRDSESLGSGFKSRGAYHQVWQVLVTRLDIPGTHNFREVAPGAIRPAVFYRADALHRLTRAGRTALADLGVRTVVDLRSDFDRRIAGRDRLRGTGAELKRFPIHGGSLDPSVVEIRAVYRSIVADNGPAIASSVRAVADSDGAVVVHCTAGKDRTGLVVAFCLLALDVDPDVVVADYALTQGNLEGEWTERMLRKVRRFRVPLNDRLVEVLAHSPEPVLRETLAWVDDEYGSALGYLDSIGIDDAVVTRLRERLALSGSASGS